VEATPPCELFEFPGEGEKSDVTVRLRFSTAPAQEMQKSSDGETLAEHCNLVACLFDFLESSDLGMIVGYAAQRFGVGSRTATTR
jgi:hypothetical protein